MANGLPPSSGPPQAVAISDINGSYRARYELLKTIVTIVISVLTAIGGTYYALGRDVVHTDDVARLVRDFSPYVEDRGLINQRLAALEELTRNLAPASSDIRERLARIEQQLEIVLQAQGIPVSPVPPPPTIPGP